jgi:hypothetical protein
MTDFDFLELRRDVRQPSVAAAEFRQPRVGADLALIFHSLYSKTEATYLHDLFPCRTASRVPFTASLKNRAILSTLKHSGFNALTT